MKSVGLAILAYAFSWMFACRTELDSKGSHVNTHEEEAETASSVGPDKAVTLADEELGFKLSPEAIRVLGIQVKKLPEGPPFSLPSSSLVYHQSEIGIYRLRDGWFRLLPVRITRQEKEVTWIFATDLQEGDAVAFQGTGFLRVADMEIFGGHEGGHAH